MTRHRRITKAVAWIAAAAVILVLLAVILFGLLQTGFVRRKLASLVSSMLSARTGLRWDIGEIEGLIPFDIHLQQLAIADGKGEWLKAEAATLRWSFAALLQGRIHVNECSAVLLRLHRIPERPEQKKQKKGRAVPWPPRVPPLIVEKVAIGRCEMGESVLGRTVAFMLEGGMVVSDRDKAIDTSLRIELLDDPRTEITLVSRLAGTPPMLSLSAQIHEEREGVLAGVLGLGRKGPVTVEIQGEGPLDSWTGRLTAKAEELGRVEADIGVRVGEELRLTGEGGIRSSVQTVMGEALDFFLDAGYGKKGVVSLHRLHLRTRDAVLDLNGSLDPVTAMLDVRFNGVLHDLTPLDTLAGRHIEGRLSAQGAVSGTVHQPRADLSLQFFDAGFSGMSASKGVGTLRIDLLGPLRPEFPGIRITGEGMVEDFRHPRLERMPFDRVQWSLAATIPRGEAITVQRLGLSAADISLAYSGMADLAGLRIKGNVEAEIGDMRRLSAISGRELSGGITLRAGLEGSLPNRSLEATMDGTIRSLAPLPKALKEIAGEAWQFSGKVRLDQGRRLFVSDLDIRTDGAELTGEASLNLGNNNLQAACTLRIPRVEDLSASLGRPLAGKAVLDIVLSGLLTDPGVEVRARVRDFSMEGIRVGDWDAQVRARRLVSGQQGHVRLDLHPGAGDIRLDTDVSLDARRLTLAALAITAPGVEAAGGISIDLAGPSIEGTLAGKFRDFASISPLLKADVAGAGEFSARFIPEETGQAAELDCAVQSLGTPFGMASGVQVHALIRDIFGSPQGSFRTEAQGVQRGGLTVSKASVVLEGDPARFVFSVNAQGTYGDGFVVSTGGDVTRSPGGVRVQVAMCEGSYADVPFHLGRQLMFSRSADRLAVEDVDLNVAGGNVRGSGVYDPAAVAIDIGFGGISLEMLRLIGYPDLSGIAEGYLRIAGNPKHPRAAVDISINTIALQRVTVSRGNPASMAVEGVLEDGIFHAKGSIEGLSDKPIRANLRVPVILSISPFSLHLPPQGEIDGQLTAEADLAPFIALLHLEEQNLEGRVNVALSLKGTVNAPQVSGRAEMSRGMYENLSTGTLLRDITLVITGDGRRLTLQEVRSTDGEKGTLSGRGRLIITSPKELDLWVEVTLNDLAALARSDMQALTSGSLSLSGSPGDMRLTGSIRVGPAELRIPDRLPPEVTDLEVIEINRPGWEHQPESTSPASSGNGLGLDLAVDVPGRVFVRGRGLDSEWRGRLHVGGTTGSPVITGDLSSTRGNFDLFGTRFTLARGSIHFDGRIPPDPSLDVTAEYRRSDLAARLMISGSPSTLRMSLESEPVLPSDEILARVLFGRSVAEMTPLQALRLAQAAGALTGRGGVLDLMGRTRRFIGVDQLVVEQSEEGITSVSVGKYLSEGVYVEMEEGIGTQSSTFSVEVELTPNITVESETGSDSQGGIGLNWKWDY